MRLLAALYCAVILVSVGCSAAPRASGTVYSQVDCRTMQSRKRFAVSSGQGLSFVAGASGLGTLQADSKQDRRAIALTGILVGCFAAGMLALSDSYAEDIQRYCWAYPVGVGSTYQSDPTLTED